MNEISMPLVWFALAAVLGIVEAMTVSLVSIWFALGAVAAIIPAFFNVPIWGQILVFLVVSALAFAFTRKFLKDVIKVKKQPTNSDVLIGADGMVTADVNNLEGTGKVYISGLTWSARSENGENIPKGTVVTINKIEGVTLIVKTKELEKTT